MCTPIQRGSVWLSQSRQDSYAEILLVDGDSVRYRVFTRGDYMPHVFIHSIPEFLRMYQPKESAT